MAILLRVIFITVGIELVERFRWILYIFGVILVVTGIKMFAANKDEEIDLERARDIADEITQENEASLQQTEYQQVAVGIGSGDISVTIRSGEDKDNTLL